VLNYNALEPWNPGVNRYGSPSTVRTELKYIFIIIIIISICISSSSSSSSISSSSSSYIIYARYLQ
jgi:hypothetical protein